MGEAKPTSTTRGQLPGIPASIDRVSAECIWKAFCNSEHDYVRHRKLNPAKPRQQLLSQLHGFEVVKNASYISVRKQKPTGEELQGSMSRFVGEDTKERYGPPQFVMPVVEVTPDRPPLQMPKYNRFSCDHMCPLEVNPEASQTGKTLARVMSVPAMK
ncbi:unnamed protein product [Symbiodinium natans]|uniref:Uncharacterized protein n=1 Tax=Symbiodinium natans TaxID=878477 RepID=A0A812UL45_9DINO|nr:unnamed protein product [Symbiodinium natans]